MGRYFKTSTPQDIDYMFKLPEELLIKATQQAAQDLTEDKAAILSLEGQLELPSAPIDSDRNRAKEIIGTYEDKINTLTQQMYDDPLAFRRKSGDIISLAKDIHKEWTKGEASAIMGRYTGYKNTLESFQKQIESGRIKDPQSVPYMMNHLLQQNEQKGIGWNPVTGNYNQWQDEQLTPFVDIQDKYMKILKEVKSHIDANAGVDKQGKYLVDWGYKTERLGEDELTRIAYRQFLGDVESQQYLLQRGKIGALQGFTTTDEQGNVSIIDPIGSDGRFNPQTRLGSTMLGIVDMFDVNNVLDKTVSKKADAFETIKYQNDLTTIKAATPDSFNTSMNLMTTPATVQTYHDQANAGSIKLQNALAISQGYLANAKMNMNEKQAVEFQKKVDQAMGEANNGNANNLFTLVNEYVIKPNADNKDFNENVLPVLSTTLSGYNDVFANTLNSKQQYAAFSEIVLPKVIKDAGGQKAWDLLPEAKKTEKIDNEIQTGIIPEFGEMTYNDIWATSGNSSDLWASDELRAEAVKYFAPLAKHISNFVNLGTTFYYVHPKIDPTTKKEVLDASGNPVMVQELATAASLAGNQLNFKSASSPSNGYNFQIPTPEEIDEQVRESLSGTQQTGKMSNPMGTAQFLPFTMSFNYLGLNGTTTYTNDNASWMGRIPITSSDATKKGYILVDGSSVVNNESIALKGIAEENRKALSTKAQGDRMFDAVSKASQKYGTPINLNKFDIQLTNGLQYNVGTKQVR